MPPSCTLLVWKYRLSRPQQSHSTCQKKCHLNHLIQLSDWNGLLSCLQNEMYHSKLLSTPVIRTVLSTNWIAIWLELDKEKIPYLWKCTGVLVEKSSLVHEVCTNCSGLTKCSSIPSLRRKNLFILSLWLADIRSQKLHDQITGNARVFKTEQNAVTLWLYSVLFDNWMWNWNAQIAH